MCNIQNNSPDPFIFKVRCCETISAMMSKNGGYSVGTKVGTLYGRPTERLAFHYDRHEEITRYIRMRNIDYHPTVMHMFCLPLKILGWFCYFRCLRVQFNT